MRALPIIKYRNREYFVDERLQEFRSNTRPIDFVSFDSAKGRVIIKKIQRLHLSQKN